MSSADTLFVGSSELAALMRGLHWDDTGAGAVDHWPSGVCAIVRMMLTSRYAMWMGWGPDLTFFYNDAYARMSLGAKHPWALGKPAHAVWAEIWPDIGPRIAHVLATGEATWDEGLMLFLERSGFPEETYHTFSYSPLHDDDGRIAGMFCVVTEETTRIIGERQLALLRALGSQLASSQTIDDVRSAVEGSLIAGARDLPFTLTYVFGDSDATATRFAATEIEPQDEIAPLALDAKGGFWPIAQLLEGTTSQPVIVDLPDDRAWPCGPWPKPPTRAMVVPIARQGQTRPAGVFIAGLNPYRPIDAAYESFILLYVGQIAAGLANAQAYDVERRRAEALAQIDRAKTTFFSNVSHELRTPLTLILGPVAEAQAAADRALKGNALDLVFRNGLRLRKLVNTLLDFSRIEAGRADAHFEPADLGACTADVASAFRSAIEDAGLRLVIDCAEDGPHTYIDRDMWEKVVLNLVSNAFKFTFDGEIAVSVGRAGDRMRLQVRDTGIGISREELPRIFERFHRVEGAVGRTHEGTGIGLSLVQELVKLHGGAIDVESLPGVGTTFTVDIPLGAAHLPAHQITPSKPAPGRIATATFLDEAAQWAPRADSSSDDDRPEGGREAIATHAGRIVLADDNADMRGYLTHLLTQRWHVRSAADGHEALALIRDQLPDLVITDVMMPRLDGFGLLRTLRADEHTRHVPVMMLSARAGEEARLEGFQAGADEYLVKPFTARELIAKVEAQLLRASIRRMEERSARQVAAVFAQAPVPIAILRGPDHVFEVANESYVALVNRPVVGRRVIDALPEVAGRGVIELLDRVYTTGVPFVGRSIPVAISFGAAGPRVFDVVCSPLQAVDGSIDGIAAVAYDVTELANARELAESANRTKDEFLAMLGHELRNPLAPILTALQLLRLRGVPGGERERTIIERQVGHLVGLVDDLLDISRITRGKVRLNPEPVELNVVVAKAIELASPLLEQHQHVLQTDVPRHGLSVMADPARLAQVISNLLTNAAKYTPAGGQIKVTAGAEGDDVVLSVRDTGIGIAPEMLPRIFDLFAQERQAIDRAQGGLGLGLAIVRSLMTLHDGSVTARSDGRGQGSEFVIRLPHIQASEPKQPAKPLRAYPGGGRADGLRVLVVDDNQDAALLLAEALAATGHTTETAHDGPTALRAAVAFKPHVALLDIGLPVMDGFELAAQLRLLPELRRTRLIAITGYGQEHDRRRSASAGFDAHLVKPVDIEELGRLVDRLTGRSRSVD
jgi:signal transduction histidine kinase